MSDTENATSWIDLLTVPLLVIQAPAGSARKDLDGQIFQLIMKHNPDLFRKLWQCRGVAADRLPVIFRTGIDVEPSTSVFYTASDGFSKPLEYGSEGDQIIMILDHFRLERSFKIFPADALDEEIEAARDLPPKS